MSKAGKTLMAAALLTVFSGQSIAAFSLNGTRYIYDEGRKNISFEVNNSAEKTFGGQVWIENTNQGDGVYFVPQPPFFKVGPKQKQVIRIIKTDTLPENKESLFWLNVQEIPPKPEMKEGRNILSVAMNTRVKLIYRPRAIKDGRLNAEKQLKLEQRGGETWLKNPTPYYFAVLNVTQNGKEVKLSDRARDSIYKLAPFSDVSLGKTLKGPVNISAVNDWGGTESYEIH